MTQSPAVDRDVPCPLCEYNLRGLIDPRCPECGHAFDWTDLLDRDRWEHPWLFEHRRKHRIGSFLRTFVTSLLPWRFWRSVQPIHKPNPRRLVIYWAIILVLSVSTFVVLPIGRVYARGYTAQTSLARSIASNPADPLFAGWIAQFGSPQAAAAAMIPVPKLRDWFLPGSMRSLRDQTADLVPVLFPVTFMYLTWPWLTILALMIFRETMNQARILPIHVRRCAIYSFDGAIVMAVPLLLAVAWSPIRTDRGLLSGYHVVGALFDPNIMLVLFLGLALLTWRLATAYRMYLRFPYAIVTCVLSQVVVGLAMITVYAMISINL